MDEPKCKECRPSKIWKDKGSEFYNKSRKSSLLDNNTEIYSTDDESKSVIAETFIRALKNKIYKHMTSILKNVCIDDLAHMVSEYKNTYHRTLKVKHVDIKSSTYTDFGVKNNEKDPKFKV